MYKFGVDGERQFVILCSGNLATTQGAISRIKQDIKKRMSVNLLNFSLMSEAAEYLGEINREHQGKSAGGTSDSSTFEASFIIGGQIAGHKPAAFLVYPQGNYITTSTDTTYLQIGESKYGKPILDRILTRESSLETASLCALVSMDSTMRSNLTVGPPIEVMIYHTDSFKLERHYRFAEDSDYLRQLKKSWDSNLKQAFNNLPPIAWSSNWDKESVQKI
jgi:putative proteasome-type protease